MRRFASFALAAALAFAPTAAVPALREGARAPDFTATGALAGRPFRVRLSELLRRGPVVLYFYPQAFTQGCTIECKSLAENGDKIRKYDVTYFMASVDSIEDNTAFAKATSVTLQGRNGQPTGTVVDKKEADFPMLADPTKATATKYGVLNQAGVANRWTFYIDKTGKVVAIDTAVRPATSAEDMIAKLEELKVTKKG